MKPIVQALILADRVYRDVSGKFIIVGVFNTLAFKRAPETPPVELDSLQIQDVGNPWVYINLTDVKGPKRLVLRYEAIAGDKIFFEAEMEVNSDDPVQSVELGCPIPRLPLIPGVYVLDLLYDGESIGSHRVRCVEIKDVNS